MSFENFLSSAGSLMSLLAGASIHNRILLFCNASIDGELLQKYFSRFGLNVIENFRIKI
jgi:hypothetical protein